MAFSDQETALAHDWDDSDSEDDSDDNDFRGLNRYAPLSEAELLTYAQTVGDSNRSTDERAAALHGIINGRAYPRASRFNNTDVTP
ncbi:hypothetical protein T439DRAFT_358763 [Meredithblackwellia eburnea MCA 4105]